MPRSAQNVVFTIAAQYTSVAHIGFLIGVSPVTNTVVAALVFRAALHRRQWTALVLGVIGVSLLAATHSNESRPLTVAGGPGRVARSAGL